MKNADGTGDAERLTEGPDAKFPQDVTGDGTTVVFWSQGDIHTLSLDGESTTNALVQTEFVENRPSLSPDGRWIAYHTDETGKLEVLVRPFPEIEDGRWEATIDGGYNPLWSPDGRELFYFSGGTMWAVPVETEPRFRVGNLEPLFQGPYVVDQSGQGSRFDIAPDGERFLMLKPLGATLTDGTVEPDLVVVFNWFDELQRLVPTP